MHKNFICAAACGFLEKFSIHFAKKCIENFLQAFVIAFSKQFFWKSRDILVCVFACVFAYEIYIHEHVECSAGIPQKYLQRK